jgi:hypothetical protein
VAAILFSVLFALSAAATTVVYSIDFAEGNLSEATRNLLNDDGTIWSPPIGNRDFSIYPMEPDSADYTGPAFFGGFSVDSEQGEWGTACIRFSETNTADRRVQFQYNSGIVGTGTMAVLFGFIPSEPFRLGDLISWVGLLSTEITRFKSSFATLAIETGGQWYTLSEGLENWDQAESWNRANFPFSVTEFSSKNWTIYNPTESMLATQSGGSTLDSATVIERMAIVFNGKWDNQLDNVQMLFTIRKTEVTAIPAP